MPIIPLIVVLILVGVALYAINNVIPMDAKVKTLVNIIVVVAACLFALDALGIMETGRWR